MFQFDLVPLGLSDHKYVNDDGAYFSSPYELNENGFVTGINAKFHKNELDEIAGWLYDGKKYVKLGLNDNLKVGGEGKLNNYPFFLNQNGQVAGFAYRDQSQSDGPYSWVFDGVKTKAVDLKGQDSFTKNDLEQNSFVTEINDNGQVIGVTSFRVPGTAESVESIAWLSEGGKTVRLGFTGPEFTGVVDGRRNSLVFDLNERGQAVGSSTGFSEEAGYFSAAWLYENGNLLKLGLDDPTHTRSTGAQSSTARLLSEQGHVTGESWRYNGASNPVGRDAWIFEGVATTEIGLAGYNLVTHMNDLGQVAGRKYSANSSIAWFYDGESTRSIGSGSGRKSYPELMNNRGQVVGYDGGHPYRFAWFFDGQITVELCLHERNLTDPGVQGDCTASYLNEWGQIAGRSTRYGLEGQHLGNFAWLYDHKLSETFELTLSKRSDGYAWSHITYLGEDGLVLGSYSLFDDQDNDLGKRAFYFTIEDGLHDLGELIRRHGVDLQDSGFDYLEAAEVGNRQGDIVGYGKLLGAEGIKAFLLRRNSE